MSDLYWKYAKERENLQVIEHAWGFITYKFPDSESAYIEDIYVVPEHRTANRGTELMDQVIEAIKPTGVKKLYGSCAPAANGSTDSMKIMFKRGFKLHSCTNELIYLIKDL